MKRHIIDREFAKFTEVNLSIYVHNIVWRLRDNPDFPAPNPPVDKLREKLGELKRDLTKLFGGDDRALEAMRGTRVALERILINLADNLEETTQDREKLATTGFDLTRR
jgi:hypothetical protein